MVTSSTPMAAAAPVGVPVVLTGGLIMSPGNRSPTATAVRLVDGRIAAVGSAAAADSWPGVRVELGGLLLTPAFVDAHTHCLQTGQLLAGVDLSAARSADDLLDLVREQARCRPAAILLGHGWDDADWPGPLPSRAALEGAAGGLPTYLSRVDVHSALVTGALLTAMAELDPAAAKLPGYRGDGWLSRDAHHLARRTVNALIPVEQRQRSASAAVAQALSRGIGAVHEMAGTGLGPLTDLPLLVETGGRVGLDVTGYWGEPGTAATIAQARSVGAVGLAGDLSADGALGSRTAHLYQPYADADRLPSGASRVGYGYLSVDAMAAHVVACTEAGLQAGFHCIGDRAVADVLTAFRRAAERLGVEAIRAGRHRIEHLEMVAPRDIDTLAELDITASVQPAFDTRWGGSDGMYRRRLGAERAARMNPFGRLAAAGVRLAFGSDTPVTPFDPWAAVRGAVTHHREAERLDLTAAVAAHTVDAHRAAGREGGRIEPGAAADLAVWACPTTDAEGHPDPLGAPPQCLLTILGGVVRYRATAWSATHREETVAPIGSRQVRRVR